MRTPGEVIATGTCFGCEAVFIYDPALCPTLEGHVLCQHCVERLNSRRVPAGMPAITYAAGAYP